MKTNHSLKQLKPAWRPRLAACAAAALALCGTVSAFDPNATCPAVTNTLSKFPVIIDGRFTNGVDEGGKLQGEWSDITPQAFLLDPSGTLFRTCLDDPNAGSFVYTALAPNQGGVGALAAGGEVPPPSVDALYLMYDFVKATVDPAQFHDGQTLAQVQFGVHLNGKLGGSAEGNTPITVKFVVRNIIIGVAAAVPVEGGGSFIDVVFDVNVPEGPTNVSGSVIGLVGAVSFGPSVNSSVPHLQAELEVGLRIPAGFGNPGGPFPGNGIDPATGLYDPAPKFWGSGFKASPNDPDPAASANVVTINPDGSVKVNSGADAGAGFVPFATINARKMALTKLQALRAAATKKDIQRALDEVIRRLQASLNPALYLDQARLKPGVGWRVFANDLETVEILSGLIRRNPGTPLAKALQGCLDKIIALDGEFARVAIDDAIKAGADPLKIKAAQAELARGDKDAAAGRNEFAIVHYAFAWSRVTRPSRGGDGDGDGDHDRD